MADDHTPEQDVAIAREQLAKGDLEHALHHLGCALSTNPVHPEWMQLLQQIVGQARDPLALVPERDDMSYVDAANRAYCLAWMRQWEEALDAPG